MSTFRSILRKIFLITSLSTMLFMVVALANPDSNELDLIAVATAFCASGISALIILYILEIEKKK